MIKKLLTLFILVSAVLFAQNQSPFNAKFMLAQSYIQAGDFEKSKPILEELYKNQPDNYQIFEALNTTYQNLKEYDSSIKLINEKISESPNNINYYGMLGQTYYMMGNDKKAYSVWDDALDKLPQNPINYRTIANYAIDRRAFEKAIEYLKKGKELSDKDKSFSLDLGSLYSLTMQFTDAAEEYCSILKDDPNSLRLVQTRILSYIDKPDALTKTIKVVEDYNDYENISFAYLLARLYIEQKSFDKAFDVYQEIDENQNKQGVDLYNFANLAYQDSAYDISSQAFNSVINKYPNSPYVSSARLGYAKTFEAKLNRDLDKERPTWKPYFTYVPDNKEEVNKVISAYENIIKIYPGSDVEAEALFRIGEIQFKILNDLETAKIYFNKIIKNIPASKFIFDAYQELGKIAIKEGNFKEAEKNLNNVLSSRIVQTDEKNSANYILSRVYFYEGNFDRAREVLSRLLSDLKDNSANDALELSLILNTAKYDSSNLKIFSSAELLADQDKYEQASEKYSIIAQNPQAFTLNNIAQFRNAEMLLAMNKLDSAVTQFEKISEEGNQNIYADNALFLLGKIYEYGLSDAPKAVEIYEKLLENFPNSLYLDDARAEIIKLKDKVS